VGGGLSGGKVAGIAVGASLGTLLLIGVIVAVYLSGRRHERRKAAAASQGKVSPQSRQHQPSDMPEVAASQQSYMPELMAPQHSGMPELMAQQRSDIPELMAEQQRSATYELTARDRDGRVSSPVELDSQAARDYRR
jgi:hypothetical protein